MSSVSIEPEVLGTTAPSTASRFLGYPNLQNRDLRIDFLRGLIMLIVITVHMRSYSLFSFFFWQRAGLVTSAEGFVALSGLVLGMVYARKVLTEGFAYCARKILRRSAQLYAVNIAVILSIAGLNLLPFIDAFEVMTYTDHRSETTYYLYPAAAEGFWALLSETLLLRCGPHQFQVIGLYVLLLAFAPLVVWLMLKRQTLLLVALSWTLYWWADANPIRITGAQFENAFPLLTWQLLFIHGMAFGWHKDAVLAWFTGKRAGVAVTCCAVAAAAFLILAWNSPNPLFPEWARLDLIEPQQFSNLYGLYFRKEQLGVGRLANNLCLFVLLFAALTRYWQPISKLFGWLLVPLGQASLYVFIVHVYVILIFSLTPLPGYDHFLLNTAMHTIAILLIWTMVKSQFLYNWIPR